MSLLDRRVAFFIILLLLAAWGPSFAGKEKAKSTGILEGTLTVTAPSRPKASHSNSGGGGFYDDESDSPTVAHSLPEEVVIYLKGVPGSYPPPKEHVKLDQKFIQFTHRVLPVLRGTIVDFTNHDPVYHNVFSNSQMNHFDLGRKSRGQKSSVCMMKMEVPVKIFCEIHADMKSNILVLDNPFFTTVQPGEKFKIEGIPPGTYTLVAWHDYWKSVEMEVTIKKDTTARTNVKLTKAQE